MKSILSSLNCITIQISGSKEAHFPSDVYYLIWISVAVPIDNQVWPLRAEPISYLKAVKMKSVSGLINTTSIYLGESIPRSYYIPQKAGPLFFTSPPTSFKFTFTSPPTDGIINLVIEKMLK